MPTTRTPALRGKCRTTPKTLLQRLPVGPGAWGEGASVGTTGSRALDRPRPSAAAAATGPRPAIAALPPSTAPKMPATPPMLASEALAAARRLRGTAGAAALGARWHPGDCRRRRGALARGPASAGIREARHTACPTPTSRAVRPAVHRAAQRRLPSRCSIHVLKPAQLAALHTRRAPRLCACSHPLMRANAIAIPEGSPASSRSPGTVHSAVRMGGASTERLATQPSRKGIRLRDIKCGR